MVLSCVFFCTLVGCEEKAPPPAKPSIVKKRIEKEPAEPAAKAKGKETPKQVPSGPPGQTVEVKPPLEEAPVAMLEKKAAPQTDLASPKIADEKVPSAENGKVIPMAQRAPEGAVEKGTAAEESGKEKNISLKASIPDESWQYDPKGKIDPFAPLFKEGGDAGAKKKDRLARPLTPLEKIDLSQLKLVAVLRMETGSRAMVEDATGKGYVITIGTRMGTHSGKVVKIQKDRVFIEEETEDFLGRIKKTEREIRLQKPSGEE